MHRLIGAGKIKVLYLNGVRRVLNQSLVDYALNGNR